MDELATKRELVKVQLQASIHGDAILNALKQTLNMTPAQIDALNTSITDYIDARPITEEMIDIFIPKL